MQKISATFVDIFLRAFFLTIEQGDWLIYQTNSEVIGQKLQ